MGGGVLSRLLGPTADEMGTQLAEWYKRKNVERVARRAEAKAHTGTEGAIPPRVAADIFDKAQWADDEFVAEYLSGVLASARTEDGLDDSAIAWTALVGRLPSFQLRLHYTLYATARHLMSGLSLALVNDLEVSIYVPLIDLLKTVVGEDSFSDQRARHFADQFNQAIPNLEREGLLKSEATSTREDGDLLSHKTVPTRVAMTFSVTSLGVLLFLRGGGVQATQLSAFVAPDTELIFDEVVQKFQIPVPNAQLVRNLPDRAAE